MMKKLDRTLQSEKRMFFLLKTKLVEYLMQTYFD